MSHYCSPDYWEDRYNADPNQFDWYQRYSALKDIMEQYAKPEHSILNIGCGNSKMSEEMFNEGYENIINIDISAAVVK